MFGIEKDFQNLMEQIYGPLNKDKMTEIEKIKKEIEVLTKKLSFLEEMENHKTPCEEAYKRVYGNYPDTNIGTGFSYVYWDVFQKAYEQAQKDYKVGEFQETAQEPEELKTLYQMLNDEEYRDDICYVVKEWMSQYTCDYVMGGEYLKGHEDCMLMLVEHLK